MSALTELQLSLFRERYPEAAQTLESVQPCARPSGAQAHDSRALLDALQTFWEEKGHDLIVVVGVGDGRWLEPFGERFLTTLRNPRGLVVIEPDPGRLLDILGRFRLESVLRSRSVLWCVGEGWEREWERLDRQSGVAGCGRPLIVSAYKEEPSALAQMRARVETVIRQSAQTFMQRVHDSVSALQDRSTVSRNETRRVWMLSQDEAFATNIALKGLADGMRTHGIEVELFIARTDRFMTAGQGLLSCLETRPDLLITANDPLRNRLGDLWDDLPIPQVLWFTDAPVMGLAHPHLVRQNVVCCFDPHYIAGFSERTGHTVHLLPTAANLLESAAPDPSLRCAISVVGSVGSLPQLLAPFSEADRTYLFDIAEKKIADRRLDLVAAVAADPPPGPLNRYPAVPIAERAYAIANSVYRRRAVAQLARFDLSLWGGEAWLDGEPEQSPIRRAYRGFIHDPQQLASLYRSSDIHVSVHSLNSVSGLNMHTWNAPVQNCFLLMEALSGLEHAFRPGEEVSTFESLDRLPDVADRWLSDSVGRRQIATAGRERAMRDHTFPVRAAQLLDIVRQHRQNR